MLLQHAIDGIVATFYTQVMFADYELQAHRLVEEGKPVTAEALGEIYFDLLKAYHGDAYDYDELSRVTWARIPHFFSTPYYVYQYATCFASSAQLMKQLTGGSESERAGGDRSLPDAAQVRRQRSPDGAAADAPASISASPKRSARSSISSTRW